MTLLSHPLTSLPITLPQEPCRDASRQLHTVDARALLARPRRVPWSSSASRPARLPPLPSKMPAGRAAGSRVVWPSTAPSQDAWPCTPGRYWVLSEAHGVPTSIWLFTFTSNYPPPAAGFKYCKGYVRCSGPTVDVVCSVTCCRTNAPIERPVSHELAKRLECHDDRHCLSFHSMAAPTMTHNDPNPSTVAGHQISLTLLRTDCEHKSRPLKEASMRETDFRAPPDSRLMAGITPSLHMTPMRLPLSARRLFAKC